MMRLELSHPFDLHPFDSIVAATLPDVTFSTRLTTTAADSLYQWEATLHSSGSLFRPLAQVVYPYNPLKRQLVEVDVRIPCHMLLLRMGGQLAGSLLMIALLAVCLLFQIKTILKQRRVDELRRSFVSTMIHELKRPVQTLRPTCPTPPSVPTRRPPIRWWTTPSSRWTTSRPTFRSCAT